VPRALSFSRHRSSFIPSKQDEDAAEEVFGTTLPAYHQAVGVIQPGEQLFYPPGVPVAVQQAAVLGEMVATGAMRRDEFDALFRAALDLAGHCPFSFAQGRLQLYRR
jgi:hypothetical protein